MRLRLARALGLLALLTSSTLPAQESAGPAPAPPPTPTAAAAPAATVPARSAACYPACRDGFTCYRGQCVSLCNPPCPSGLECVEGHRCEPPLPQSTPGRPYEPPPPPAKEFAELSHSLLGFHLGLPGNVQADERGYNSDTTLGFNVRADTPVAKYLLLGPMLQFGSWRYDVSPPASHNYFVDLDLVVRVRLPIVTSKLNYQVWLGMPIGISIQKLAVDNAPIGLGWNIGVLFGGAIHLTSKFGLFAEAGWEQHRITHSNDEIPDVDIKLQQPLLNLGFIVRN